MLTSIKYINHSITPNKDRWFCPDILQSDWLRALRQESKCLGALSQSDSSLSDLPLFECSQPIRFHLQWFTPGDLPCSIFSVPNQRRQRMLSHATWRQMVKHVHLRARFWSVHLTFLVNFRQYKPSRWYFLVMIITHILVLINNMCYISRYKMYYKPRKRV